MKLATHVAPGLWRLPFNSSTLPPFDHTNGWLVVDGSSAALVDPGFRDAHGLELLAGALRAAGAEQLTGIWLTHAHHDHCEGLSRVTDVHPRVPIHVHGLEASRVDMGVSPRAFVVEVHDRDVLTVGDRTVRVLHTPGHSPGHVAYVLDDIGWILAGDLLAGHGSVWVGAPEGDVRDYLESLARIGRERPKAIGPGHGDPIADPRAAIEAASAHRLEREAQIVSALAMPTQSMSAQAAARRGLTLAELRTRVYPNLEPALGALAERSLAAHLDKLIAEGRAEQVSDAKVPTFRVPD